MFSSVKIACPLLAVAAWILSGPAESAQAVQVSTAFGNGADIELTENGGPNGAAVAGGNGTKGNMNARWFFAAVEPAVPDRNEWAGMRFDLSEYENKAAITNVALKVYMHRGNPNNNKNLHFYALTPGTAGENWDEASTTYATMPGFTFDMDSTTNILDVGGAIVDLGAFSTTGVEAEGALATITLPTLTSLVQSMGTNDLLTILINSNVSTSGQWRALTKEATGSENGVITGAAGDFAPYLEFTIASSVLAGDFNNNTVVDAADYAVWRENVGTTNQLPNDTIGGTIGDDQYNLWKANFGKTLGGGSAAQSTFAVPEPSALAIAGLAISLLFCAQSRRDRRAEIAVPEHLPTL